MNKANNKPFCDTKEAVRIYEKVNIGEYNGKLFIHSNILKLKDLVYLQILSCLKLKGDYCQLSTEVLSSIRSSEGSLIYKVQLCVLLQNKSTFRCVE